MIFLFLVSLYVAHLESKLQLFEVWEMMVRQIIIAIIVIDWPWRWWRWLERVLVGANPNNILEGGRPCSQPSSSPGRSPKFSKILETEEWPRWRLWWPSFGSEKGASEREGHWRLASPCFYKKFPLKLSHLKVKVFWPLHVSLCLIICSSWKDPNGSKVLDFEIKH